MTYIILTALVIGAWMLLNLTTRHNTGGNYEYRDGHGDPHSGNAEARAMDNPNLSAPELYNEYIGENGKRFGQRKPETQYRGGKRG